MHINARRRLSAVAFRISWQYTLRLENCTFRRRTQPPARVDAQVATEPIDILGLRDFLQPRRAILECQSQVRNDAASGGYGRLHTSAVSATARCLPLDNRRCFLRQKGVDRSEKRLSPKWF